MFRNYMKNAAWKWLLCSLMSASVAVSMFQGFNIADSLADNFILAAGAAAALQLVFVLFSYNIRSIVAGIISLAVFLAGAAVYLRSNGINISDEPGGATTVYIYYIVTGAVALAVYLLASSRIGCAVLFSTMAFTMTVLKFLEFEGKPVCFVIFEVACVIQFVLLNYDKAAKMSDMEAPAFARCSLTGAVAAGLALLLAAGVCFAVIKPLDPPTHDLHLITKHITLKILDMVGVTNEYQTDDPSVTSDRTDNAQNNDPSENNDKQQDDSEDQKDTQQDMSPDNGNGSGDEVKARAISYEYRSYTGALYALAAVLALILIFAAKIFMRRREIRQIRAMENDTQVEMMYLYLLKRFNTIGYIRHSGDTAYEYSENMKDKMRFFSSGDATFDKLTDLFVRVRYGGYHATDDDCRMFYAFYDDFYKNCKLAVGRTTYISKWFFI